MKFGLHLPNFGALADPAAVAGLAATAEAAGWDGFFLWDHVARPEGVFPMLEPWIGLAAVAARTQRMRIGPLVTPLARRRPWNVARQVASLDHLSGGRVTLRHRAGRQRARSSGTSARRRTRECAVTCSTRAWPSSAPPGRASRSATPAPTTGWTAVALEPPPVQAAVPIWGATERTSGRPVRRAAALDGVFPVGLAPAQLPDLLANVSALRPGGLDGYDVVAGGTDDWREWRDAGATWWLRVLPWSRPLPESEAIAAAGPPAG